MTIKMVGNLTYKINTNDEIQSVDTNQVKQTKSYEELSSPQFKEDSAEYLSEFNLVTDNGDFKWQVITSVDMNGSRIDNFELINHPLNIEIINNNIEFINNED